jgi:hypothetical protein
MTDCVSPPAAKSIYISTFLVAILLWCLDSLLFNANTPSPPPFHIIEKEKSTIINTEKVPAVGGTGIMKKSKKEKMERKKINGIHANQRQEKIRNDNRSDKERYVQKIIYSFRIRIFRCCYLYSRGPRSGFVKGTMPRDFRLQVFFMNQFHPSP